MLAQLPQYGVRFGLCVSALVLGLLLTAAKPTNAGQTEHPGWCPCPPPESRLSSQHEVLTLEEAVGLLHMKPWELERLALRRSVPARRVGTQ